MLLLQEGSADHAIQLYCDETGAGWEDAAAAIAQLSQRHGIPTRRSRGILWLVAGMTALLGFALAFHA